MKERNRDFRYCLILAGQSNFKNQAISSRGINASSIKIIWYSSLSKFWGSVHHLSSLWQSHSLLQKCAKLKGVKGDRFEWHMILMWHCVADVSLRDSSEVTGGSLHIPLILPQLGIAFQSPPVGAAEFYVWVKVVTCPMIVFLQTDVRWWSHDLSLLFRPYKFQLVSYDGFYQKHEALCVGCHKYFTIADLLGGIWRPAARSSHSAVRATTAKIPMFLNESPFYYSFL